MKLLLRADASPQMGTGHVMRCLALAQSWEDSGGVVHFATVELPERLAERLAGEGMALHWLDVAPGSRADAQAVAGLVRDLRIGRVVIDGYHFDTAFQRTIKDAGPRLLVMDDYGHAGHYVADLILNQNIHAEETLYTSREPYTRLLLGTRYALLRREFQRWRGWQRTIPSVARKVLISLGGDPDNMTFSVVQRLQNVSVDDLEAVVLMGASNIHWDTIQMIINSSRDNIQLQRNITDMPSVMAWADVAVSAGGTTCWELAFMGLPFIVIHTADNQRWVVSSLDEAGVAISHGLTAPDVPNGIEADLEMLMTTQNARYEMSQLGRTLVDGHGAARVCRALNTENSWACYADERNCDF